MVTEGLLSHQQKQDLKARINPWREEACLSHEEYLRERAWKKWRILLIMGAVCVIPALLVVLIVVVAIAQQNIVKELRLDDKIHNFTLKLANGSLQLHSYDQTYIATSTEKGMMSIFMNGSLVYKLHASEEMRRIDEYTIVSFHFFCFSDICYEKESLVTKDGMTYRLTPSKGIKLNGTFILSLGCMEKSCSILYKSNEDRYVLAELDTKDNAYNLSKIINLATIRIKDNIVAKAMFQNGEYGGIVIYEEGILHLCITKREIKSIYSVQNCFEVLTRTLKSCQVDIEYIRNDYIVLLVKEPEGEHRTRAKLFVIAGREILEKNEWTVDVNPPSIAILKTRGNEGEDVKVCHLYEDHLVCRLILDYH